MWRWLTPASSPVPCHPADRNSNGASSWVSFGTDGGFVHLVSPPPLLPSMRNCTTCTVHTFAQLVKLCTKGFLTFGLVAVNMHRARCESCTKDECTDWSQTHASALYWSGLCIICIAHIVYRVACISGACVNAHADACTEALLVLCARRETHIGSGSKTPRAAPASWAPPSLAPPSPARAGKLSGDWVGIMRPKLGPENNNNNVSPILFSKLRFDGSLGWHCKIGSNEELLKN